MLLGKRTRSSTNITATGSSSVRENKRNYFKRVILKAAFAFWKEKENSNRMYGHKHSSHA